MNDTLRLFFALWPDDQVRKQLGKIQREAVLQHRGRPVHVDNLHITLAFIGHVPTSDLPCLEEMAERIRFTPFTLQLDQLGAFSRSRVLWLGASEVPEALQDLARRVNEGVAACGFDIDERPFKAHLTLMRKVSHLRDFEIKPVTWSINSFCLVQSHTNPEGVQYEVLRSFHSLT
ncbi:MAG: RNA 2',3'-cyclic phosphodiesterase [Granulosicoccaceae bacterium]|jgi:2'-5' RNA ligase